MSVAVAEASFKSSMFGHIRMDPAGDAVGKGGDHLSTTGLKMWMPVAKSPEMALNPAVWAYLCPSMQPKCDSHVPDMWLRCNYHVANMWLTCG